MMSNPRRRTISPNRQLPLPRISTKRSRSDSSATEKPSSSTYSGAGPGASGTPVLKRPRSSTLLVQSNESMSLSSIHESDTIEPDPEKSSQHSSGSTHHSTTSSHQADLSHSSQRHAKLKAVTKSVVKTAKQASAPITRFFAKLSPEGWERQKKDDWNAMAEERMHRVEKENKARQLQVERKRERDRQRQQDYRAKKRKAEEVEGTRTTRKGKVRIAGSCLPGLAY